MVIMRRGVAKCEKSGKWDCSCCNFMLGQWGGFVCDLSLNGRATDMGMTRSSELQGSAYNWI